MGTLQRLALLGGVVVASIALAACWASAEDPGAKLKGSKIPWKTDLDVARIEARKTGRPLMVVFR